MMQLFLCLVSWAAVIRGVQENDVMVPPGQCNGAVEGAHCRIAYLLHTTTSTVSAAEMENVLFRALFRTPLLHL